MKKATLLAGIFFMIISCFCCLACEREESMESDADSKQEAPAVIGAPDADSYHAPMINEENVTFIVSSGSGTEPNTSRKLRRKVFMGSTAESLRKILAGLEPTGEAVPAFSDTFEMPDRDGEYDNIPSPQLTFWIEVDDIIYRIDGDEVCMVSKHFGAGLMLGGVENFWDRISRPWYNYPGDYWRGDYIEGEMNMQHVCATDTTVSFRVKDVAVLLPKQPVWGEYTGSMIVELTSAIDQTLKVKWKTQQSDDQIGSVSYQTVTLGAGETVELSLSFWEMEDQYWLTIEVDNVTMGIYFHPPVTE